jgi:hypothetical protein
MRTLATGQDATRKTDPGHPGSTGGQKNVAEDATDDRRSVFERERETSSAVSRSARRSSAGSLPPEPP